jgi:hypothetical protein
LPERRTTPGAEVRILSDASFEAFGGMLGFAQNCMEYS